MLKVGVIGASGYTGGELLRILSQHPKAAITAVTSEQSAGQPVEQVFPHLSRILPLTFDPLNSSDLSDRCDFFFVCLPHTVAMDPVARLYQMGKRVVDLSADYRFHDPLTYEKWYGEVHRYPHLLKVCVYGLPELNRKEIQEASLVGTPGCYPTAILLPLFPLLKRGIIDFSREIIIDAKSGISGAGRTPTLSTHFPEVCEGMEPYNVGGHRHLPEIVQEIRRYTQEPCQVVFTPHLIPISRGILCSLYVPLREEVSREQIEEIFVEAYRGEPFIRLLRQGYPNPKVVQGANFCDISFMVSGRLILLFSAIDNLVKGAAGQAVQNMNLMMGYEETLGLVLPALYP